MCFRLPKGGKLKKARTDIYCFKLVEYKSTLSEAESPVYHFLWEAGEVYETPLDKPDAGNDIEHGFHSCKTVKGCRALAKDWDEDTSYDIAIFVIPKGTRYYENKTQYCSESLKMIAGNLEQAKLIYKALKH